MRTFYCFILLLFMAGNAIAQEDSLSANRPYSYQRKGLEINVSAGGTADVPIGAEPRLLRRYYNSSDSTSAKILPKPGFRVGFGLGYNFGNGLYIGTGAYAAHRGWWEFYRFDIIDGNGVTIGKNESKLRHVLYCLTVPVETRFQVHERLRLNMAFQLGFLLNSNIKVTETQTIGASQNSNSGNASYQSIYGVGAKSINYLAEWGFSAGNFDLVYVNFFVQYSGNLLQEGFSVANNGQAFSFTYDYRTFGIGLELCYTLIRPKSSQLKENTENKQDRDSIKFF